MTLFQLLTGHLPFTGQTDYEIMEAHLHSPPPSIRQFNPEVPPELEAVVLKALAKDPHAAAAYLRLVGNLKPDGVDRSSNLAFKGALSLSRSLPGGDRRGLREVAALDPGTAGRP